MNIEEKVWLLEKKDKTYKNWQGSLLAGIGWFHLVWRGIIWLFRITIYWVYKAMKYCIIHGTLKVWQLLMYGQYIFTTGVYKYIYEDLLATDNISSMSAIFSLGFPTFSPCFTSNLSIFSQSVKLTVWTPITKKKNQY